MNPFSKLTKLIPQRIAPFSTGGIIHNTKQLDATSLAQDALFEKKDCTSQGHVANPSNKHQQDIQSQYVRSGKAARTSDNFGIDTASPNVRPDPGDKTMGNPEGIGMLEQVGSASATSAFFRAGGKQGSGYFPVHRKSL